MNKTKIIATLGPGTQSEEKIVELIQAGMNVARINLSHGDRDSIRFLVRYANIAETSLDYETILAAGVRHRRKTVTDALSYRSVSFR